MSIRVERLTKIYGNQRAVDDITFEVVKGRITGFLGPNGAGKSTTMKIATGFISPTGGEVFMDEIPVSKYPLQVKKITGYLPEHNPLYLDMYVKEFLHFIGKAYGMNGSILKKRIAELIGLCGLDAEQDKKLGTLSKGYRQRAGLAKALLSEPKILVLDEPTTGLDPNQIVEIRQVIRRISQEKTVLFSTHIMQEVDALCDNVIIINEGKIVADTSVAALKKTGKSFKVEVAFDTPVEREQFKDITGLISIKQVDPVTIHIESSASSLRSEILKITGSNELPLSSLRDIGGSLEDIFHELTQGEVQP